MTTTKRVTAQVVEVDGSPYLFTFSPIGNTKNAEFTYYDHLSTYFVNWHKCMSEFEINPEFNSNGNLHYHGYFVIKDKVKWFKNVLPKMKYNGLVKISKVRCSLAEGVVYCRKDRIMMSKIIKRYPVPYTHKDSHIFQVPDIESKTIEDYLRQIDHGDNTEEICQISTCCCTKKHLHDLDYGAI